MLESLTIFQKGGLILFQHLSTDAVTPSTSSEDTTSALINAFLEDIYLNPTQDLSTKKATLPPQLQRTTKTVVEWDESKDLLAVALYPDISQEFPWIRPLVTATLQEYQLFIDSQTAGKEIDDNHSHLVQAAAKEELFQPTFQALLQTHKKQSSALKASTSNNAVNKQTNTTTNKPSNTTSSSKGKEKRQWHDGKGKVTKETMAALDRSKQPNGDGGGPEDDTERALAEARAAYLPTDADLQGFNTHLEVAYDDNEDGDDSSSSWGGSLKSLFQQATGNKVLTKQDLEAPLKDMQKLLESKNVASDISQQITAKVEQQLVGKKLNSMFRVKTAVRQAVESVMNKLLAPSTQLDLLRQVVSKRSSWTNKRPYVIVVVGINGVGKSTSLAKLAYFLKSNGCSPLLAACDTFRSGAVEQLSVHAKCLDLPIYAKGYSKDPSSVASAAIEQAVKDQNDVVLVDTAGRMQNNVPLMKALGKLAHENQPDMIVFVGEALVGNDGVDQVRMFNQAVSSLDRKHKIDSILLTKFDTVSDKVGAALTMTHVTNAPILFVGTGQKYHHLQKLSTSAVIASLFR
jgi:signal recognition particle receptor subunit alpha